MSLLKVSDQTEPTCSRVQRRQNTSLLSLKNGRELRKSGSYGFTDRSVPEMTGLAQALYLKALGFVWLPSVSVSSAGCIHVNR
jgi:hypothetical protein